MKTNLTPLTKIVIAGLVACALSLWIQWLSGDPAFPKFPPGPFFFLLVAGVIAVGRRWWWTPLLGTLVAVMTTLGWFARLPAETLRLTQPGSVGSFAAGIFGGTLLQIVALLVVDVVSVAAVIQNFRTMIRRRVDAPVAEKR